MLFLKKMAFKIICIIFSILFLISCGKENRVKNSFKFSIGSVISGLTLNGNSFVRAKTKTTDEILKLDANNSIDLTSGTYELQTISYEGPQPFSGRIFCGLIPNLEITGDHQDVVINISEANCLIEPFLSLISKINQKYNPIPAPSISSLSLTSGPLTGGASITIIGTGFSDLAKVDFGGALCSGVFVLNPTTIYCTVPSHAAGTVVVTVTNTDAQFGSLGSAYTYQDAPTISSITPSAGSVAGLSNVTITGTGFLPGANVFFDSIPCTVPIVLSSTTLTCTTPAHVAGISYVTLSNLNGQWAPGFSGYTFQDAPNIISIVPNNGSIIGGSNLSISGSGFISGATVDIGGSACAGVNVVNSSLLTCISSAHNVGSTSVTITNPDLQVSILSNGFTYNSPPTVTGVNPTSGILAGGNTIIISGTDFINGASVALGGVSCASVNYINSTTLTCITTSHSAGSVEVKVTNSDGQWGAVANAYTFNAPPWISIISPTNSDIAGGRLITINGTGFQTGATLNIGGVPCTGLTVVNSTTINCTTGAHAAGIVSIVLTNADSQIYNYNSSFSYADLVPPDLSGINFNDGTSEWSTTNSPLITWNAGTDIGGNINNYEIAIGSTPGGSDIQNWTGVGPVNSYQFSGLILTRGQIYYASIRATDNSGNVSSVVQGDGWFVTNEMWTTDGTVNAMAQSGNTLYLGGAFTKVNEWSGGGVPLDIVTGLASWPNIKKERVYGVVSTSLSDGSGGYYIGGTFTAVGGIARNNLAHLLANGSLDLNWNPNINGSVYTMVINGSSLYIGGLFNTVNGNISRANLAAFDLTTGLATNWNPSVTSSVNSIAISGATLYAAGAFTLTNAGTTTRNYLAAFDLISGTATSWNPNLNNNAFTITIIGSTLYVGGLFTTVNGSTLRNRLAAIDLLTGTATNWDPNVNNSVITMAVNGTSLIVGGGFTTVNGSTIRNYIAEIDISTGLATNWDPNLNGSASSLLVNGSTLFVGGTFTTINGSILRNNLVAIDIPTGLATNWNPIINSTVNSLSTNGTSLYVGGTFTNIGPGLARTNLAAFDLITGSVINWSASTNGNVYTLAVSGSTLYVGGGFLLINGITPRSHLAALDLTTGIATSWDPNLNNTVYAISINGSTLYAGGTFTIIGGGTTRNYLAGIDLNTGIATSWNPNLNNYVNSIDTSGSILYAGGTFTLVNGSTVRNRLAGFDLSTGTATTWDPNVNGNITSIVIYGSNLYIGGAFTLVNSSAVRNYLAEIDLTTGMAASWNPNLNGAVLTLAINGTNLYVGGSFTTVNGSTVRNRLAAIDLTNGTATSWDPNMKNTVNSILISNKSIFAGGSFLGGGAGPSYFLPLDPINGIWLPGN